MTELTIEKPIVRLEVILEALLFVSPGPVTPAQLAMAAEHTVEEVIDCLHRMETRYRSERGLRLQWHAGKVQLTTAPELSGLVEKFLGLEATARLSRAALETLAIVAYRQPVTRPGIDSIRGVNSDGVLKSLLSKGLLQETGRSEGPGRPILYGTSNEFLQHFGLASLAELPPYDQLDETNASLTDNQLLKD